MNINSEFKPLVFQSEYGYIDYFYIKNDKYSKGLIVLNGAIVHKEYRGTGKFKLMLKTLFFTLHKETLIQGAIISKKLVKMFKRIGFKEVKEIEYWRAPSNCTQLEGVLTTEMINLI
jgi:hypothetical protein